MLRGEIPQLDGQLSIDPRQCSAVVRHIPTELGDRIARIAGRDLLMTRGISCVAIRQRGKVHAHALMVIGHCAGDEALQFQRIENSRGRLRCGQGREREGSKS
ncbi:MAG: hypothetical protein U0Q11_05585 [Vicinamibacterales bacterium]